MSSNEYDKRAAAADVDRVLSDKYAKPRDLAQAWVNRTWLKAGNPLIFGDPLRCGEINDTELGILAAIDSGRLAPRWASGAPATPRPKGLLHQGHDWQDSRHVNVSDFIDAFVAGQIAPPPPVNPGVTRPSATPPQPVLKPLSALEAAVSGGDGAQGEQKAHPAPAASTRTNILDAPIKEAKRSALDPNDASCVWAVLVAMAESHDRPAPLLGYVEGEGVKYQGAGDIEFLTRKNFGDRIGRERRAKARKRA